MQNNTAMSIPLSEIVTLLDSELRIAEIRDASVAMNGLQVENNGQVSKVALAVDGSQQSIDAAIAAGADLLILHHGIFWCGLQAVKGWWKHKLQSCLDHNLAIYSAHLPLDMHPVLGNNAGIAKALGLEDVQPEVDYHGTLIGLSGIFPGTVGELEEKYSEITGAPVTGVVHDTTQPAGRIALCSGGGGEEIYQMQAKGYGTYLTGEENHWVSNAARDMGINILFAGHYATETFGVKALGELLAGTFDLPTVFIDNPTGM